MKLRISRREASEPSCSIARIQLDERVEARLYLCPALTVHMRS